MHLLIEMTLQDWSAAPAEQREPDLITKSNPHLAPPALHGAQSGFIKAVFQARCLE
jgi:hypothetical protein